MIAVRRWARLWVLSLVIAVVAALVLTASSWRPLRRRGPRRPRHAAAPVQMNYACTSKVTGLMRYVSSPTSCTRTEHAVTIVPGPVYVCVYFNLFFVRQVAALRDCSPSFRVRKALTLPPSSAPVYFCATDRRWFFPTYATGPSQCPTLRVPGGAPVAHTAPVLANIESSTLQFDAGTPPVPVTNTLTVANPHGPTLVGATVTITSGFTPSEDELSFPNQNGIIGSYNASTGVLSLTGTASVADYQAALRSATYTDLNGTNPTTGPRTIAFQINDGASSNNLSNVDSRDVQINPNSPPMAGNVNATTEKHTAIDIDVLASASDPDGDQLSLTQVNTTGTLGAVSINPNGTVHYDPNGQFNSLTAGQSATDTFGYTVSDGFFTASATVTVTITGVNDQPVLSNIETTPLSYRAQDPAVPVTSALTVSDDDDATIGGATVSITSGFSSGNDTLTFINQNGITGSYNASTGVLTLSGNDTVPNYQAALRSVEFSTTDSSASPAARTVSFTVTDSVGATSSPASRTIDVGEANQPPVAVNQSYDAVGNTTARRRNQPPISRGDAERQRAERRQRSGLRRRGDALPGTPSRRTARSR